MVGEKVFCVSPAPQKVLENPQTGSHFHSFSFFFCTLEKAACHAISNFQNSLYIIGITIYISELASHSGYQIVTVGALCGTTKQFCCP